MKVIFIYGLKFKFVITFIAFAPLMSWNDLWMLQFNAVNIHHIS